MTSNHITRGSIAPTTVTHHHPNIKSSSFSYFHLNSEDVSSAHTYYILAGEICQMSRLRSVQSTKSRLLHHYRLKYFQSTKESTTRNVKGIINNKSQGPKRRLSTSHDIVPDIIKPLVPRDLIRGICWGTFEFNKKSY